MDAKDYLKTLYSMKDAHGDDIPSDKGKNLGTNINGYFPRLKSINN
jgi:hypothetical protein